MSYSTGNISASGGHIGGVVGQNNEGVIYACYETGSVSGTGNDSNCIGGIAGINTGYIYDCYATGAVSGHHYVGGVIGYFTSDGEVMRCVALNASVTVATDCNRVIGYDVGRITAGGILEQNYGRAALNRTNPGHDQSGGADVAPGAYNTQAFWSGDGGLPVNELGWDFDYDWEWDSSHSLPKLR